MRVSYLDNEARALIKIHGVSRYVQVGSSVLKKVVTNISDDGVCLNPVEKNETRKKNKKETVKAASDCLQFITFQYQD